MSLFGFLGKVATGFLAGGPVGAIAGGASHLLGGGAKPAAPQIPRVTTTNAAVLRPIVNTMPTLRPAINIASAGPGRPPQLPGFPQQPDSTKTSGVSLFPGGPMVGTQTQYFPGGGTGAPPKGDTRGYHLNKSGYWVKGGKYVEPNSKWVKNRRRNPLNPRALSRSISRISSAKNAAKFLGRVTVRPRAECR